ncbi:MAG: tetratricopeptide repeat protein [Cellulosilyticum sp.]|nr:tetratricopeptide repeat protein [Cellulosilyticum sp.]
MKIVFINVPWMKYYAGEGDEEVLVPACGYNFQHVNGYYYGYGEGMDTFPIEKFEGVSSSDEAVHDVTVIWTAHNRKGENKVIGWYKKATIYKEMKESLSLDSERTIFKYSIKAPAKEALLLPVELRLLDARPMEEGVYFESDESVIRDIAMYIHNYQDDKMNFVFQEKDLEGKSVLNFPEFEMYFAKADEFLGKDLYGRAVRCFNKAIEVEPELAIGYECKGSIFLSLKMYDEALKIYQKVLELEPDNEGATYCMGLINGLLGNYEESLEYYNTYLQMRKNDHNALAERGIVHYYLNHMEQAKRDIQKAYKKEQDNESLKVLIDYIG